MAAMGVDRSNAEMNSDESVSDTRKREQLLHDAGASDYDRAIVSEFGMKHKYFTTAEWAKRFQEPFLDYGCGTGVASRVLAEMNRKVVAFDISPRMASITRTKVPYAHVIVADALNLPLKDRAFPTICITGVLHHILDLNRAFDEICRCGQDTICINEPSTTAPYIVVRLINVLIHAAIPLVRPIYYLMRNKVKRSSESRYRCSAYERPLDPIELRQLLESRGFRVISARFFNHIPFMHLFLPEQIRRALFRALIHPEKGTHVEIIARRAKQ